jgi:plasmid replication initiation protein
MLANAWDNIKEPVFHTVRLHELRGTDKDNTRPRDSIKRLMHVVIAFDVIEDGIKREVLTHLLGDCKLDYNPHGLAHYSFSDSMRKMLVSSSVFARLRRDLLYQFRSKYALTLYEMLQQRINLSYKTSEDFTLDEIRKKLGVAKEKHKIYRDLNTHVLKTAVLEVNGLSDIACSIEPIKQERSTVGLRLSWRKKEIDEAVKSVEELQKHSAGRQERLSGQVVQIFPNEQPQINRAEEPKLIKRRVRELDTRECEQLKKTFFGYDIYSLYNEFQHWIEDTKREIPDNPPAAFTNWLKSYYNITGKRTI